MENNTLLWGKNDGDFDESPKNDAPCVSKNPFSRQKRFFAKHSPMMRKIKDGKSGDGKTISPSVHSEKALKPKIGG